MKFILFYVTLDLSDNLTEMRQSGLSWKTQMGMIWSELSSEKFLVVSGLFCNGTAFVCHLLSHNNLQDVFPVAGLFFLAAT